MTFDEGFAVDRLRSKNAILTRGVQERGSSSERTLEGSKSSFDTSTLASKLTRSAGFQFCDVAVHPGLRGRGRRPHLAFGSRRRREDSRSDVALFAFADKGRRRARREALRSRWVRRGREGLGAPVAV